MDKTPTVDEALLRAEEHTRGLQAKVDILETALGALVFANRYWPGIQYDKIVARIEPRVITSYLRHDMKPTVKGNLDGSFTVTFGHNDNAGC